MQSPYIYPVIRIRIQYNAEPDPAALVLRIGIQLYKLCKKLPYEEFSVVEKQNKKDCLKVKEKNKKLVKVYLKL